VPPATGYGPCSSSHCCPALFQIQKLEKTADLLVFCKPESPASSSV
jgi:hypothetical protein